MELGMIGLGKMGLNMADRLVRAGHHVVGFDLDADARAAAAERGAVPADSLHAVVVALTPPRAIWIMVPAGAPVDATIASLLPKLEQGDVVLDGGNSNYRDTIRRAGDCRAAGVELIDVGTSGGVWGLQEGYSMMVGGDAATVERLRPIFEALAPAPDRGWGRTGPAGAGHFTKMIHNGIEYGLMQAYAEGFAILEAKEEFDFDLAAVADIWRYGSVIRSWLLDLTTAALEENPDLEGLAPFVPDSGEGRWTVAEAIDLDVAAPVITLALLRRLASRDEVGYADRLLSAMRNAFGGHAMKRTD